MLHHTNNGRQQGRGLHLLLGCLLFDVALRCEAQNLVPNPGFEEADTCLVLNTYYYPETGPLHWFTGGGSTDHFQSCLPYGAFNGVPLNVVTFQMPYEGEAYGGVVTYNQQFGVREYWMVQLLSPLLIGQTYYASFYANAAFRDDGQSNQAWIASSGMGMLFTVESRQFEPGDPLPIPENHAHIYHSGILADTIDWVLISGTFVADSAYQYVMIGNHFDDANIDTLHFEYRPIPGRGYTLIDKVCVSPDPEGCALVTGTLEALSEYLSVYPNPARDLIVVRGLRQPSGAEVLDGTGRVVWTGIVSANLFTLEVGSFARGSYMLRLDEGFGSRSFKFMLIE